MPEKYRRPHWHEAISRIEQMKDAWLDEREALLVVRHFNYQTAARGAAWFWPKVATAIVAKHPWMVVACDSCSSLMDLDLRMKPRDPEASIRIALRDVCCPRCNGHGRPRITGLARSPGRY